MSGFIKQTFIVLLLVLLGSVRSFSVVKAVKCVSINDLNLDEFDYYPLVSTNDELKTLSKHPM